MVEEEEWGRGPHNCKICLQHSKGLRVPWKPHQAKSQLGTVGTQLSYPLCQALEHWPHQILKGGRRLLCANLADPALVGAARDCGLAVAGAAGLSTGHLVDPAPTGAACDCVPAVADAAGLLTGRELLRAVRGCGRAGAAELRWTCGPDSSAGDQRQEEAVKNRLGNLHLRLSPTE